MRMMYADTSTASEPYPVAPSRRAKMIVKHERQHVLGDHRSAHPGRPAGVGAGQAREAAPQVDRRPA